MSSELKQLLVSVLQEALNPIHSELQLLNHRVGNIESRIGSIESRVGGIESRVGSIESRFDNIEPIVENIGSRVGNIESRVGGIESELKDFRLEMKTEIQLLKVGQQGNRKEITDRFVEVKKAINSLQGDIETTYHETAQNKLEINRLKRQ